MSANARAVVVLDPGLLSTIQDLGRAGVGALGVSPAGAADWFSARAANRLAGNPDEAPLVETTLTGASFEARTDCAVAVTGADARVSIGARRRTPWRTWRVSAGERIVIEPALRGLRSYVAFDGGVQAPRIMGSASTDVGGGFGGRMLAAGDLLALGVPEVAPTASGAQPSPYTNPPVLAYAEEARPSLAPPVVLRAMIGPHAAVLGADVIDKLFDREFRVTPRSSRQALRLEPGTALMRRASDAVSAGVCAGCVQVTGDGSPVVMLAEHQTTGGYPVGICVVWADMPQAAQARPGDSIKFVRVDFGGARRALAGSGARLRSLGPVHQDEREQSVDDKLARGFFEGV